VTSPAAPAGDDMPDRGPNRGVDRRFAAGRSILALMLREMSTRFGRTPGGYAWVLIQPLAIIIILSLAFSLLQSSPSLGTSFLLFKATGFMILSQFRTLSQLIGGSLGFSRALLEYPGVVWIDAILARFVLNALVVILTTWIILQGTLIYEGLSPVLDWSAILTAMGLSLLLGLGVGCLNCYLFQRFDVWQQAWGIITSPLFIISGVIMLYEDLPQSVQGVLWYNPIYHLTGLMRQGFYSTYTPSYISVIYVLFCALIPMVLGLLLLRRYHRELMER
jgi:capsular polysaccharide transport system permease protein